MFRQANALSIVHRLCRNDIQNLHFVLVPIQSDMHVTLSVRTFANETQQQIVVTTKPIANAEFTPGRQCRVPGRSRIAPSAVYLTKMGAKVP